MNDKEIDNLIYDSASKISMKLSLMLGSKLGEDFIEKNFPNMQCTYKAHLMTITMFVDQQSFVLSEMFKKDQKAMLNQIYNMVLEAINVRRKNESNGSH